MLSENNLTTFLEKDSDKIRTVYGFQNSILFCEWLCKQKNIKEIVELILGEKVYLHQTKINYKNKSADSIWPFHRDFPFWNNFDQIKNNAMVNIVIFLDNVNEGSGELKLIPKSHKEFLERESNDKSVEMSLEGSASRDLLFSFTDQEVDYFQKKSGCYKVKGPKGSILVFDPNIIHGSDNSLADQSRGIMLLTFNKCDNKPVKKSSRPEYLCSTNYDPIKWLI